MSGSSAAVQSSGGGGGGGNDDNNNSNNNSYNNNNNNNNNNNSFSSSSSAGRPSRLCLEMREQAAHNLVMGDIFEDIPPSPVSSPMRSSTQPWGGSAEAGRGFDKKTPPTAPGVGKREREPSEASEEMGQEKKKCNDLRIGALCN